MQKVCNPQNYILYFQVESKVSGYGSDLTLDWSGEGKQRPSSVI